MSTNLILLDKVIDLLDASDVLVERLNGQPLNERLDTTEREDKTVRIERSRQLQELANHLELAAALVRHEYWVARGATDPIYTRKR